MIYMLLVTALVNGHPDTQATSYWLSRADCEKARQEVTHSKPGQPFQVLASGCFPVEKPE